MTAKHLPASPPSTEPYPVASYERVAVRSLTMALRLALEFQSNHPSTEIYFTPDLQCPTIRCRSKQRRTELIIILAQGSLAYNLNEPYAANYRILTHEKGRKPLPDYTATKLGLKNFPADGFPLVVGGYFYIEEGYLSLSLGTEHKTKKEKHTLSILAKPADPLPTLTAPNWHESPSSLPILLLGCAIEGQMITGSKAELQIGTYKDKPIVALTPSADPAFNDILNVSYTSYEA